MWSSSAAPPTKSCVSPRRCATTAVLVVFWALISPYMAVYVFRKKELYLQMLGKMQSKMGVGDSLVGSLRKKAEDHDWASGPLRLGMSGEGQPAAAAKYSKHLIPPPSREAAKKGRQSNGRVSNDGAFWLIPGAAVLVGGHCVETVEVETYVWRSGATTRVEREAHEGILFFGLWGGLVFTPGSRSLNQKFGGTFTDGQRRAGGKFSMVPLFVV